MKKNLKPISKILALILSFALLILPGLEGIALEKKLAFAERNEENAKVYSRATIEDDFDGGSVLVVLDKKTGGINKQHKESFFGTFQKTGIIDLSKVERVQDRETLSTKEGTRVGADANSTSLEIDEETFRQILEIRLPKNSKENVLQVIKELEKIDGILYAGTNDIGGVPGIVNPNDPYFVNQSQWGLTRVDTPNAWDITTGSRNVRVGIIDTGISSHADLNANLTNGWNFANNSVNTNDSDGHGTHVSGIIGAVGNNKVGVAGVAWDVTLVPLKIEEGGAISQTINAIAFAGSNNIPIINHSWWNYSNNYAYRQAIQNYPGLYVCSAGNGSANIDNVPNFPASFNLPNMIVVGASRNNDQARSTSNFGAKAVHIFAPGEDILSTVPTSVNSTGYQYRSGTSMATPYVAGVAALILSVSPSMSATQIKQCILDGATSVPALRGLCVTGGRLNAHAALQLALKCQVVDGTFVSGNFSGDGTAQYAAFAGFNNFSQILVWEYDDPIQEAKVAFESTNFNAGGVVNKVVVGDFDGCGRDEIAAFYDYSWAAPTPPTNHTTLFLFKMQSNGMFSCTNVFESTGFNGGAIAGKVVAGNFDGSGVSIAAFYEYGYPYSTSNRTALFQFKRQSNGQFNCTSRWESTGFNAGSITNKVTAGDFDGCGRDEIAGFYEYGWPTIVPPSNTTVLFNWKMETNGTTTSRGVWDSTAFNAGALRGKVTAGDYDLDGKAEIAAFYEYGYPYSTTNNALLCVFKRQPNGSFTQTGGWSSSAFNAASIQGRVTTGDHNGDGRVEINAMYLYGDKKFGGFRFTSNNSLVFALIGLW